MVAYLWRAASRKAWATNINQALEKSDAANRFMWGTSMLAQMDFVPLDRPPSA